MLHARWKLTAPLVLTAACSTLWLEVHNPARIPWRQTQLPGCAAQKADGLVLQHIVGDDVWATEGYDIYESERGREFLRIFTIHPPLGEAWGGFVRAARTYFGYQEVAEVVPLRPRILLAFAGGSVYRIDLDTAEQQQVLALRYFGRGKGRGVMSRIAIDDEGQVFFGEYMSLYQPHTTRIWRGRDEGRTWDVAYEFRGPASGHVHGVQWDPFSRAIWVMTGDSAAESRIGWSGDAGEHFTWIGEDDERFRACSLIFTPDAVLWATDTWDNRLFRWDRATKQLDDLGPMPSQSLYAQRVDEAVALIGQSNWDASVLLLRTDGALRAVARFTPQFAPRTPLPGVRLARADRPDSRWIYFNPLRTREEESAIYRITTSEVTSCSPPPTHLDRLRDTFAGARRY